MIGSFAGLETEAIFHRRRSRKFAGLENVIRRKLIAIEGARLLMDLYAPPGNRLEALKGDRAGQHSIRINQQFRICFRWEEPYAYKVEIVDYH